MPLTICILFVIILQWSYLSSYNKEKLLVDVRPALLLSLFENFEKKLKAGKLFSMGYYIV